MPEQIGPMYCQKHKCSAVETSKLVRPIVEHNIFQGTDATVGDGFAPLGPTLLPWEGGKQTNRHRDY